RYRGPGQVPGGVLVVGASASGVQIADELRRAGRPVVISVGRHARLPRRYRDRDILWWMEQAGVLGQTIDQVHDARIARRVPSLYRRNSTFVDGVASDARFVAAHVMMRRMNARAQSA